jgi:hypothetical protein
LTTQLRSLIQTLVALGANACVLIPCNDSVSYQGPFFCGRLSMPKKAIWLFITFTLLFILGINTGELNYLLNTGSTICLACIGVG